MADEVNLGRLVAEIALDNQSLQDSAEESIETLNSVEEEVQSLNTDVEINVTTTGAREATEDINNIPSDNIPVDVTVTTTGALTAAELVNNIPSDDIPIDVTVTTTGATEATEAIRNIPTDVNVTVNPPGAITRDDALENIRLILSDIGVEGERAEQVINNMFSNTTNVQNYLSRLETVSNRIEQYQSQLHELEQNEAEARRLWDELNEAAGRGQQNDYVSQYSQEIETVTQRLRQQEAQYDRIQNSLDNYVQNAVAAYDRQIEREERVAQRQEEINEAARRNQLLSNIDAGTTAAEHFFDLFDNAPAHIQPFITAGRNAANAIQQCTSMIQSGASASMVAVNGVLAVASIAVNLIISLQQQAAQAEEEARQQAYQTAQAAEQEREELQDTAQQYLEVASKLNEKNISSKEELELKNQLSNIQDEIIKKYGDEAGQLDILNNGIQENITLLRNQAVAEAQKSNNENLYAYKKAKDDLSQSYTLDLFNPRAENPDTKRFLDNAIAEYESKGYEIDGNYNIQTTYGEAYDEANKFMTFLKEKAANESEVIQNFVDAGLEGTSKQMRDLNSEARQEQKKIVEEYEKNAEIIASAGKSIIPDVDKYQQVLNTMDTYNATVSELSNAYKTLSDGQALSSDKLTELTDKYPELAKYVQETGDLTFDSGKKIKEVYEEERKTVVDSIQAQIDEIQKNKETLEARFDLSEEEKNELANYQKQYSSLTAVLKIYNSELSNVDYTASTEQADEYSKKLKELTSVLEDTVVNAFDNMIRSQNDLQTVSDEVATSNQISLSTLNDLQKKYPELTDLINDYINGRKDEADIIKAMKDIYDNDVDNYNKATKTKILASENFYQTLLDNNAKLVNDYKEKYDIDLKNYKSVQEAKVAIQAQTEAKIRTELAKTALQKVTAEQTNPSNFGNYSSALIANITGQTNMQVDAYKNAETKRIAQQIEQIDEQAKQAGQKAVEEFNKSIDKYYKNTYSAYAGVAVKGVDKNKKTGSNSDKSTTYTTRSSDGIIGTGSTYAEANLDWLSKQKNLGRISTEYEINYLKNLKKYRQNTADDLYDIEYQLYQAEQKLKDEKQQKQEEQLKAEYDRIDKLADRGKISTQQEVAQLEQIYKKYKLTTEQKIELEEKLYQKKKQLKDEDISALDTLGDAVVNALKNKYEQQKELEEKRIDESIESWKKWENETCEAIQGQIDALDELKNVHDEENDRQEYENKRQALELQARYEKDDYNRKQIQKEIAALDKDENERLFNLQIEQQKKALQEQMDNIKEISQNNQDSLNDKKDTIAEKYDKLTSDFALKAEAQKTILESSQKELIKLINSYAPEYEMAGTSLGEALYNGFKSKTSNISGYVGAITSAVDKATNNQKKHSALASENFWKYEDSYYNSLSSTAADKSSDVKETQSILDKLAARVDSLLNSVSSTATAYKKQMAITANAAADRYYSTQQYYTNSTQSNSKSATNVYMTVNFNDKVDSPIEVKRQMEYVSQQLAKQISS